MRITNILPNPRYFSYANTVGTTLKPGETSIELPLTAIHNTSLWKDIDGGCVKLTLNEADKLFLNKLLRVTAADAVPEVKTKAGKQTTRQRRQQQAKLQRIAREAEAAEIRKKAPKLINPGGATGQPVFGKDTPIPVVELGKAESLEQLKRHNHGVELKRATIPTGVPSNPAGSAAGQPVFSPGPGPGTENKGIGKAIPTTVDNMKRGKLV
jgi:hypothetical protein